MAGSVISLEEVIFELLRSCHDRVYLEQTPATDPETEKPPEMPYLVYNLPAASTEGYREDFILEVDGWDQNPDTTPLELLMDSVDRILSGYRYFEEGKLSACFYREGRHRVADPEAGIIRRQLVYVVKTYFIEGGNE